MRLAALTIVAACLIVVTPAAAAPTIRFVDGHVQITGTGADDDFTIEMGTEDQLMVRTNVGTWADGTEDGVCLTVSEHATCEFEDPGRMPVDVVADLGAAGADVLTVTPGAPAVRSVTASYASATSAIAYHGGTPATVLTAGETDTLSGVSRIAGSAFADHFVGGPDAETLLGGAGDDTFDTSSPGGGPADTVDCGDGVDTLTSRAVDAQSGCEIVNGTDTRPGPFLPTPTPAPVPPTRAPQPPYLLPPGPPAAVTVPQPPATGKDGTLLVTVECPSGCAGKVLGLKPPPPAHGKVPGGLPAGWDAATAARYFRGGSIDPMLAQLARLSASKAGRAAAALAELQKDLAARTAAIARLKRRMVRETPADRAREQARLLQLEAERRRAAAVLELQKAIVQAALAQSSLPAGARHQVAGAVDHSGDVKTPLDPAPSVTGKAHAARAKAPTRRTLARWLLQRTALALPSVSARLKAAGGAAGTYRATIKAPVWLRSIGRVFAKGGVKALPVNVAVGGERVAVVLPLPR